MNSLMSNNLRRVLPCVRTCFEVFELTISRENVGCIEVVLSVVIVEVDVEDEAVAVLVELVDGMLVIDVDFSVS